MNELVATYSMDVLLKESEDKKRRESYLATDQGKTKARSRMTGLLEYLNLCGYRLPDGDYKVMADIWVRQLEGIIIAYGFDVLQEAVETFVKNDCREYRQIPNAGQIIDVAKQIGYNPDAELARRRLSEEVARQDKAKADEVSREMTEERRKELLDKFPNMGAINEIWRN